MQSKINPNYDAWRDYNYKMKQLRQYENDNFIRVPKKVRAVRVVSSRQLELL